MPDLTPIEPVEAKPRKRVRTLEPMVAGPRRAPAIDAADTDNDRGSPLAAIVGPIFTRARDIIAANVNDIVERADDPARMIRMVIMEMEEVLGEVRATAARSIADLKELRIARDRVAAKQDDWQERAELALEKGREDLARQALIEKERLGSLMSDLGQEMTGLEDQLKSYEAEIQQLQSKLSEARRRQAGIASRIESAMTRARAREAVDGTRTAEAFARFEELERRADEAEGRAEALALGNPPSLEDQIAALKAEDSADAALAAMKAARDKKQGNKE